MARRKRRKSRKERIFTSLCLGALALSIVISLVISNSTGKFDFQLFAILSIIFIVIFGALLIVFSLPAVKGKIGEASVSSRLKKLAKKYGGVIINDVMIPGDNNKTSQIDHIYVSNYGVFVVETKNYAGLIYGSDEQKEWTQVLAYGNTKNKLYNPVKQNQTHIFRLSQALSRNVNLISVIVFVRADLSNVKSDYTYTIRELRKLLDGRRKVLSDTEVEYISGEIMDFKLNPVKGNKEHVQEIKQMKKDISSNICPRCGGKLVLRNVTSGSFYGCENYPKCKFTKKA